MTKIKKHFITGCVYLYIVNYLYILFGGVMYNRYGILNKNKYQLSNVISSKMIYIYCVSNLNYLFRCYVFLLPLQMLASVLTTTSVDVRFPFRFSYFCDIIFDDQSLDLKKQNQPEFVIYFQYLFLVFIAFFLTSASQSF